jgi:hypothetical protein
MVRYRKWNLLLILKYLKFICHDSFRIHKASHDLSRWIPVLIYWQLISTNYLSVVIAKVLLISVNELQLL